MQLAIYSATHASPKARSPHTRKSCKTCNTRQAPTRTIAHDARRFISPFPGAYGTGAASETQSIPGTAFLVALLGLSGVLMGAFIFMLHSAVNAS